MDIDLPCGYDQGYDQGYEETKSAPPVQQPVQPPVQSPTQQVQQVQQVQPIHRHNFVNVTSSTFQSWYMMEFMGGSEMDLFIRGFNSKRLVFCASIDNIVVSEERDKIDIHFNSALCFNSIGHTLSTTEESAFMYVLQKSSNGRLGNNHAELFNFTVCENGSLKYTMFPKNCNDPILQNVGSVSNQMLFFWPKLSVNNKFIENKKNLIWYFCTDINHT